MAVVRALLISVLIILVAFVGFAYWSGTAYYRRAATGAVGRGGDQRGSGRRGR